MVIQIHRHKNKFVWSPRGREGEDKLRGWDKQMHAITHKIDEQQGFPV